MAEIIGLVSGGAGLASLSLQLLETAIKLREVYKTYKDGPAALSRIADEVELFGLLLRQMERDRQAHDVSDDGQAELLGRSIQLCQSSVASITDLTGALQSAIGRSKRFGKLKNMFEEREIKDLCAELERAKSSLGLAHQLYTESRRRQDDEQQRRENQRLIEQQSVILIGQNSTLRQVSQDVTLPSQQTSVSNPRCAYQGETEQRFLSTQGSFSSSGEDHIAARRRTQRRSKGRTPKAGLSLNLRPWFTSTIWRITVGEAVSGWDIALRTANVVPEGAPIFRLCAAGDLLGMQKLIASGKASILDEFSDGITLLETAIHSGHVNICQFLLQVQEVPSDWALNYRIDTMADGSVRNAIYSFLFQQAGADADFLVDIQSASTPRPPTFWSCCPDTACLQTIMSSASLDYKTLPLEVRFRNAGNIHRYRSVELFIEALGEISRVDELSSLVGDDGSTVLHHLAQFKDLFASASAKELFGKVLRVGADLNATDHNGYTPLAIFLERPQTYARYQDHLARVRSWMELLNTYGVETMAYARRESEIWQCMSGLVSWHEQYSCWFSFHDLERQVDGGWDTHVTLLAELTLYTTPANVPGIWPTVGKTPSSLPWRPTERDFKVVMDGIERLHLWSAPETHQIPSSRTYLLSELLNRASRSNEQIGQDNSRVEVALRRTQDDCGTVWFASRGRKQFQSDRKRSSSQPADIRESFEHVQRRSHSNSSGWLGGYHRCRADSRWRFGGKTIELHRRESVDQRRCAHGECMIDEDIVWSTIRQCLDYEAKSKRGHAWRHAAYRESLSPEEEATGRRRRVREGYWRPVPRYETCWEERDMKPS